MITPSHGSGLSRVFGVLIIAATLLAIDVAAQPQWAGPPGELLPVQKIFHHHPPAQAEWAGPPGELNRYIVVLKEGTDPFDMAARIERRFGVVIGHVYTHALQGFAVQLPPGRGPADLFAYPAVVLVEPDLIAYALGQTLPTGVNRIDADLNVIARIDGVDERVDVDIAIIDSGIDKTHPDLYVVGGVRFYANGKQDGKYDDQYGHGSHVAGTAAAKDNDIGVVGVAPGGRLWAVRVLDASGFGWVSDVIKGIDWVTENASVIEVANMSLGWQGISTAARTAIQNSVAQGVVYVVAAGNDSLDVYGEDREFGTSDDFEPASYPEVATISAMADSDGQAGGLGASTSYGDDDCFATFSNYSHSVVSGNPVTSPGMAIDLAAPGVNILSTYKNGQYAVGSGTSMSSPHVAGAAALHIAQHGRAYNATGVAKIRQALINLGEPQSAWCGGTPTGDRDEKPEPLVKPTSPRWPPPSAF